jgi:hypothetical protein
MLQHVRFSSKNRPQRCRKRRPRAAGALRIGFSLIFGLVVLLCLAPLLIAGCITTSAPPNPGGVIQVWVEQSSVRVLRNGKTLCVIKPKLPRVEQWKLVQNDTAIVIKSRGTHIQDPAAVELFDINTGALKEKLMTYSLYTVQPTWARGFEDR